MLSHGEHMILSAHNFACFDSHQPNDWLWFGRKYQLALELHKVIECFDILLFSIIKTACRVLIVVHIKLCMVFTFCQISEVVVTDT